MIPALRRVGPDERRHEHDAQHDEYTYIRYCGLPCVLHAPTADGTAVTLYHVL